MQTAVVFSFPIDRRDALVRQTARALARLHGEAANAFWRKTARGIFQEMLGDGRDEGEARAEISRFCDAVQAQLRDDAAQGRDVDAARSRPLAVV